MWLNACTTNLFYLCIEYLHQNADQIKREFKHLNVDPIAKDYLEAMNEIRYASYTINKSIAH